MAKETDIKSLGIFGSNSGLDKIRAAVTQEQPDKQNEQIAETKHKQVTQVKVNEKGAGAPIRQFDRVYSAKAPLKLSALLNSTSRNLVEKYETGLSRDELLRKALDDYVKQNLSMEDKQELYQTVLKDLELFREKHPTVPELNKDKEIIRTIESIENETSSELRIRWGIK